MGMWVHGEPGACVVVTVGSLVREDFMDGASWVLVTRWWGQVSELAWVNVVGWGGLWEPLENRLELCPDGRGKVVRCHLVLSRM
jgi:hypothetical protein